MRPYKVETALHCFRMSPAVIAGFSGYGDSIYSIIPLFTKSKIIYIIYLLFPFIIKRPLEISND